jgi:hypothetical protein
MFPNSIDKMRKRTAPPLGDAQTTRREAPDPDRHRRIGAGALRRKRHENEPDRAVPRSEPAFEVGAPDRVPRRRHARHGALRGAARLARTAALSATNPNLADAYRERSPKGGLLPLVKALEQLYPFVKDATYIECNDGTRHKILSENMLPVPTYRGYNEGVAASKDKTQVVAEVTAMAASLSKIDVDLVKLNGPEYRARRVAAQMRGQLFDLESKAFYSSAKTSPKQFHGLFPRLDATTNTPAGNQVLKIDAAPVGSDQHSIALLGWGPESVFMTYPQGSAAGIEHEDMGEQLTKDAGGTNEFRAYVDWVQMTAGFAVANYRYVARACNIDGSALSTTGTNILDALDALYDQVEYEDTSVRWVYYWTGRSRSTRARRRRTRSRTRR